ncbi:PfkB family carbohydrate kinase [Anaeromyxobacter oryzae]|uniref:Ribokinase n=1 Tax=Anaeromyxobacter oryzae TaxID=2918170 RepID=A0ABN6MX89_9BACT|nr:PfkB family carbohydrate kinase [Anaeromyxobacter oryzae]BDG04138.1 ribokinase [Anaeromyxobacter oryzae]
MSPGSAPPLRIAVIGHVEHITLGRVPAVPRPGEIAHLEAPRWFPGGGGGVAFWQLARGPAEVHLFTALGDDEAARDVEAALAASGARIHAARRAERHTRDVVMVTPDGERTIVVVGEPLHPRAADPLPWDLLGACDAAYFTAQDPDALRAARAARLLVLTARRRPALIRSGVRADVVVGSAVDPREASALADYPVAPGAVVLTEGSQGGRIETAGGTVRFPAPPDPGRAGGAAYGAGDSFAGALVYYLAAGLPLPDACARAGRHGAAVLRGTDPREAQEPLAPP